MIAFAVIRHSSISHVTSRQIWPRTATNDHEPDQLQPELQPPMSIGSLLHTALTVLAGLPAEQSEWSSFVHLEHCRATADCLSLIVRPPEVRRVEAGQRPPADAR